MNLDASGIAFVTSLGGTDIDWKEAADSALNALTPDLWLRYGLEMGWVGQVDSYIVTYGLKAVTDLRESYDEALKE